MKPMRRRTLYCSFCGRSDCDVEVMVAGPTVFICNLCVDHCVEFIAMERELKVEA